MQKLGVFSTLERYVQGRDATLYLGDVMKQLGIESPVLIFSGNSARRQLESTWATTFSNIGYEHRIFPFGGECTKNEIEGVAEKATVLGCKCIIGEVEEKRTQPEAQQITSRLTLSVVPLLPLQTPHALPCPLYTMRKDSSEPTYSTPSFNYYSC
jgi:hypothetical protein